MNFVLTPVGVRPDPRANGFQFALGISSMKHSSSNKDRRLMSGFNNPAACSFLSTSPNFAGFL